MYEYIDTACRIYEDTDCQERNMFQISCAPQPMEHWQDYIDLVKNDGDENAFLVFLHYYEPTINGKVSGQDVMGLLKPYLPEPALLRKETRKYIRAAFHKLGYRDQDIVSRHLGFYKVCFRPLFSVSFEDLADIHQFSTADGVRKAYKRALEKMRTQLEEWGVLESVRAKQIKKTTKLWQFEYRPMDAGEPGLIEFTVKENKPVDHRIVKPAEMDITDLRFGREAAHMICRLAEKDDLPKNEVLVLPDGDLMPRSYK